MGNADNLLVEMIDVWEIENCGDFKIGKKHIVRIINGAPYFVENGYGLEARNIPRKEAELIIKENTNHAHTKN